MCSTPDGLELYVCPVEAVDPEAAFYCSLFPDFREGILWTAGQRGEQPHRYIEAMNIIRAELATLEHQRDEEQREERERMRGLGRK